MLHISRGQNRQDNMTDNEGRNLLILCLACLICLVLGIILGATIERRNQELLHPTIDFIMLELEEVKLKDHLLRDLLKTLEAHGMELDRLIIQKDGVNQLDTRLVD